MAHYENVRRWEVIEHLRLHNRMTDYVRSYRAGCELIRRLNRECYMEAYVQSILDETVTLRAYWLASDDRLLANWRFDLYCDPVIIHLSTVLVLLGRLRYAEMKTQPRLYSNPHEVVFAAIASKLGVDATLGGTLAAQENSCIGSWLTATGTLLPRVVAFDVCCGIAATTRPNTARALKPWITEIADAGIHGRVRVESTAIRETLRCIKEEEEEKSEDARLDARKVIEKAAGRIGEHGFFQDISRGHCWAAFICAKDVMQAVDQCNSCQAMFRADLITSNSEEPARGLGASWDHARPWQCAEVALCSRLYERAERLAALVPRHLEVVSLLRGWAPWFQVYAERIVVLRATTIRTDAGGSYRVLGLWCGGLVGSMVCDTESFAWKRTCAGRYD